MTKDGHPYIFLHELCKAHDLQTSGSKQGVLDRLTRYFFDDPARVPDYISVHFPVDEWLKAKNKDAAQARDVEKICANLPVVVDTVIDEVGSESSSIIPMPSQGTLTISEFPITVLAIAFQAKKYRLYPDSETLFLCHQEFTTDLLDQALAGFDTSAWEVLPVGQEVQVIHRKTPTCALRLFVLLLVDDSFYERLVNESAAGPLTRDDLDVSAIGDNSNLWVDVCKAFKDDDYLIPVIPVHHRFFIDRTTKEKYDISSCLSKWVTPGKLRKWYNTCHNALVMYRCNYDKSGHHSFHEEEGLEEFVTKFCQGNKDCCFLAVLAIWRGSSALEWFSAALPKDVVVLDGLEDDDVPLIIDTASMVSAESVAASGKSKETGVGSIGEILNAMKKGESPEKKAYFVQKTKLLQFEEGSRKRKAGEDKRRSDMGLARDLRREYKEYESGDEEEGEIKKCMRKASFGIMKRLLAEVEGGLTIGQGEAPLDT